MVQDIHSKKKKDNDANAAKMSHPGVVDFAQYKQLDSISNLDNPTPTSSTFANVISQMNIDNQHIFQMKSEKLWVEASTKGELLSLLLCDIDQFEAYLDNYGEQSTSFMLLVVALALKKVCEKYDCLLSHYQKHEFAILLKGGDEAKAEEVAQALREGVASSKTEHKYSETNEFVTLSVGVSSIYPNSMELMLRKAEQALTSAKAYVLDKGTADDTSVIEKSAFLETQSLLTPPAKSSDAEASSKTPQPSTTIKENISLSKQAPKIKTMAAKEEKAASIEQDNSDHTQATETTISEQSLESTDDKKKDRFSALKSLVSKPKPSGDAALTVEDESAQDIVPQDKLKSSLLKHIETIKTSSAKVKDKVLTNNEPDDEGKSALSVRIDALKAASDKTTNKAVNSEEKEKEKITAEKPVTALQSDINNEQATETPAEETVKTKSQSAIEKHIAALKMSSLGNTSNRLADEKESETITQESTSSNNTVNASVDSEIEPVKVADSSIDDEVSLVDEEQQNDTRSTKQTQPANLSDNSLDFEPLAEISDKEQAIIESSSDNSLDFEPLAEADVTLDNSLDFEPLGEVEVSAEESVLATLDNSIEFEPLTSVESVENVADEVGSDNSLELDEKIDSTNLTLSLESLVETKPEIEETVTLAIDKEAQEAPSVKEPTVALEKTVSDNNELDLDLENSSLENESEIQPTQTMNSNLYLDALSGITETPAPIVDKATSDVVETPEQAETIADEEVVKAETSPIEDVSAVNAEPVVPAPENVIAEPVVPAPESVIAEPVVPAPENVIADPVEASDEAPAEDGEPAAKPMSAIEKHIAALKAAKANQGGQRKATSQKVETTNNAPKAKAESVAQAQQQVGNMGADENSAFGQALAQLNLGLTQSFNKKIEALWKVCLEEKELLSLFIAEIDFFKAYTEHYGEEKAEQTILKVAASFNKACSKDGVMAFYLGKGNFQVLIKGGNATQALRMAEKTRRLVVDSSIAHQKSKVDDVITMSIGLNCVFPTSQINIEQLKQDTDEAVTMAVLSGRNQTHL